MKYSLFVAMREYAENAKTKGFWVGLLLFPVIIAVAFQVPSYLEEKATPTRNFVLVDQSGLYEEVVDKAVLRSNVRKKQEAFTKYMQKYMKEEFKANQGELDLEKIPAMNLAPGQSPQDLQKEIMDRLESSSSAELELLGTEQGWADFEQTTAFLMVEDRPPFEEPRVRFRRVDLPTDLSPEMAMDELSEGLKPYLTGSRGIEVEGSQGELFAAILIPEDAEAHILRDFMSQAQDQATANMGDPEEGHQGVQYWSVNLADLDLRSVVERGINNRIREQEYVAKAIDIQTVRQVENTRIRFKSLNPKKAVGEEEVSLADTIRQWAPVGFVYLLWIAIMTVVQMLLNNTIEEKSNRIIEVLLSSVTPWELMVGKLIGIAAVGLTMLSAWILSLVALLAWKAGPEATWAMEVFEVVQSGGLIPAFLIYFILGYLTYAGIFLAIGSICNTLKEAQNFMGPVMLIMMVPLITMMFIPKDPNGTLATVLSWIPLYTPFVMMNRAAADPPMFDKVGTLILMVVSCVVVMWLSAKIFRIGILRTGQPPKLLELFRWLKG
ncbi:MAG: ABC transporter permease [Planctomycetota bacterium]|nr:MAG: ABC transporter permease [Planctomycetota bacterium]